MKNKRTYIKIFCVLHKLEISMYKVWISSKREVKMNEEKDS